MRIAWAQWFTRDRPTDRYTYRSRHAEVFKTLSLLEANRQLARFAQAQVNKEETSFLFFCHLPPRSSMRKIQDKSNVVRGKEREREREREREIRYTTTSQVKLLENVGCTEPLAEISWRPCLMQFRCLGLLAVVWTDVVCCESRLVWMQMWCVFVVVGGSLRVLLRCVPAPVLLFALVLCLH